MEIEKQMQGFRGAMKAAVQSGGFVPIAKPTPRRWRKAGEVGAPSTYFIEAKKALARGARRGKIASAQFFLFGGPNRAEGLKRILEVAGGSQELSKALAGVEVHHDGRKTYRLTLKREENPGIDERIPLLEKWWNENHLDRKRVPANPRR